MQKGRLIGATIGALIGLRGGSLWNVFFCAWFGAWLGGLIASRTSMRRTAEKSVPPPRRTPTAREQALRVLGLPPNATFAQARAAYRKLARKYHPDTLRARGADPAALDRATQTMARLNAAWRTLSSAN